MPAGATTVEGAAAACVGTLIPRGEIVLAACSGGADSVALAAALSSSPGIRVVVGHVDHGLRQESVEEAAGVRALAQRLGVPSLVETLHGLETRCRGLEASAREARYPALLKLARLAGARYVATAHTRRDQAETLLLRLARGAGPGALAGVRRRRDLAPDVVLVRPLLGLPRSATEAFCARQQLPFVVDPHNLDARRARGRLRALWPALLAQNPRLEEALAGTADALADEDDLLDALSRDAWERAGGRVEALAQLHPALLLRALLAAANAAGVQPGRAHLRLLGARFGAGDFSLDLPGGRAVCRAGGLHFERPRGLLPVPAPGELAVPGTGRYAWGRRTLEVMAGAGAGERVDLERAPFPWTLRTRRPGDRFRPAGGRIKKVADLLIDAHIPQSTRGALGLLLDGRGEIFFVEGLRGGAALRGEGPAGARFQMHPEMDASDGAFCSQGQSESRSATMNRTPDEELR